MFTDDTCKLEDLCGPNDKIYAIVPSPQTANVSAALAPLIPASLSRPIHDHVENCKTDLEPPVEKENKRLADLEAKLEAKWEEERKREKAEREEERRREQVERTAEKAEADKKYEDLRQHLLEVEETTMDTVGWIAHNVCHRFSIFI